MCRILVSNYEIIRIDSLKKIFNNQMLNKNYNTSTKRL